MSDATNTFYAKVFPCDANMFVCESGLLGGLTGRRQVRAEVKGLILFALLDIMSLFVR